MTHNYVDSNLCDFKDQIMDVWAARRAEKRYFPDSALSGKIDKDTLQKTTNVKPSVQNTNGENSLTTSDGKDDGKISFKEKMQNFGEGLVKPIKNIFASPKNMAITAATIAGGAALIALTSGAAAPVMVAAGLIGGAVQIGKGIYKQVNAKTDNEAKQAWQEMGTGTFTLGVSAAGAKSSLKAAKVDGAKDMSVLKAAGKCLIDLPKNIKASVKNISSNIKVAPVVDVTPEPTSAKPTGNVTQEPSVAPTAPVKPAGNVTQEPSVAPTAPVKPAGNVPQDTTVVPAVSSKPEQILALPEPKANPAYILKPKEVFQLHEPKVVSPTKSPEILALPEPPKRLALPEPKNINTSEKVGILARIKRFLNVFGLFLPKNN